MPRSRLPKGVHRVRRKTSSATKFHFYAWRGGPNFWEGEERDPVAPEFFRAYSKHAERRPASEYMTPQMVDDFLDSTAMPKGERTKADYCLWALRFAEEFADDPVRMWANPASRGELNEWRARWKHAPRSHDYAGTESCPTMWCSSWQA